MREISPSISHSCDEFLKLVPPAASILVSQIREQKRSGNRPVPSSVLIDQSTVLDSATRRQLIDRIALLVDENLFGRSEMCEQFAVLLTRALQFFELPAQLTSGDCSYYINGSVLFSWTHYWVRIGAEVIDVNTDVLSENPAVPNLIRPLPYWGPIQETPADRRLRGQVVKNIPLDPDVEHIWWPELEAWLKAL